MERILLEWEKFARENQPDSGEMNVVELRDHASEILKTVAHDLRTPQTETQRATKAKGETARVGGETAAEVHADDRWQAGFSIDLLVAEYRALRASVLHLWLLEDDSYRHEEVDDLIRFNEAIDQALAESVSRYSSAVQTAQDVFLGILGHDLRSPLQALGSGAQYLIHTQNDPSINKLGARLYNSVRRMGGMLDNLLDFTESRLGGGIKLALSETDLADVSAHVVEEFQSYNPDRVIRNEISGDCKGVWDAGRLAQIYQNLIGNALQYGVPDAAVTVLTREDGNEVVLSVHSLGATIPKKEQETVFKLFHRHDTSKPAAARNKNYGLGLYIVGEIVSAHHGTVRLTSTETEGTTFEIRIPKEVTPSRR